MTKTYAQLRKGDRVVVPEEDWKLRADTDEFTVRSDARSDDTWAIMPVEFASNGKGIVLARPRDDSVEVRA